MNNFTFLSLILLVILLINNPLQAQDSPSQNESNSSKVDNSSRKKSSKKEKKVKKAKKEANSYVKKAEKKSRVKKEKSPEKKKRAQSSDSLSKAKLKKEKTKKKKTPKAEKNSKEKAKNKSKDKLSLDIELKSYLKSEELSLKAQETLDNLGLLLVNYPEASIEVQGHTSGYSFLDDREEEETETQKRSLKKAQLVMNYLIARGVPEEKLEAFGKGNSEPKLIFQKNKKKAIVLDNNNNFSRMSNERVIIKILLPSTEALEKIKDSLNQEKIAHR